MLKKDLVGLIGLINAADKAADDAAQSKAFWRELLSRSRVRLQSLRNAELIAALEADFSEGNMQGATEGETDTVHGINQAGKGNSAVVVHKLSARCFIVHIGDSQIVGA